MKKATKVVSLNQARIDAASTSLNEFDPASEGALTLFVESNGDRLEVQCDSDTENDGLVRISVCGVDGKVKSCHYAALGALVHFFALCDKSIERKDIRSERKSGCA